MNIPFLANPSAGRLCPVLKLWGIVETRDHGAISWNSGKCDWLGARRTIAGLVPSLVKVLSIQLASENPSIEEGGEP